MDFELSKAQRDLVYEITAGVTAELCGPTGTSDQPFDRDQWRRVGKLGLLGLCLPQDVGGRGLSALDTALALQAFGHACPDTGLVFAASAHLLACAVPVRDHATAQTRQRLLPGLANGDLIAANAMTESDAGSDVSTLAVTARRSGDDYRLTGTKSFASNAPLADVLITYATTDARAGFLGISAFAVPRGPQVSTSPPYNKMGLNSCPAGSVTFTDCPVPADALLGAEGAGSAVFQHSMMWERSCLFAGYLGLMQRQLQQCIDHVGSRRQYGHPLTAFQAVTHRIATMQQRLEAAQLLLYRACWLIDQERPDPVATAISKTAVSEASVANSLDAVRLFGGNGYLRDHGIETMLRDSIPSLLFSGTNDIQHEIIARAAGL